MNPLFTQYHTAIWEFLLNGTKNLIINAGPGSGKTWSIKNLVVPALIQTGSMSIGCIAFNSKNAAELKAAISHPSVECSTVHSALWNRLKRFKHKIRVEVEKEAGFNKYYKRFEKATKGKTQNIADMLYPDEKESVKAAACRLVSLLKMNAFELPGYASINDVQAIAEVMERHSINNNNDDEDSEGIVGIAQQVFQASIRATGSADYDDMIYLTLYLNAPLPDWDALAYDEGQDMKPADLEFLTRMKKKGCRIVVVGDTRQGINFFTGSMQSALEIGAERLEAETFPLPVSYRCSKIAAELANEVFPGSVIPGPNAKDGETTDIPWDEFLSVMDKAGKEVAALSRVHRFLIPLALSMIKQTREFRYKGIADTVHRMNRMLYNAAKQTGDLCDIRQTLVEYQNQLEDKYADKPQLPKWVTQAGEITDCLSILLATVKMDGGDMDTVKRYLKALENAEKSTNGPTLSTIHAAKGGEWPNVYILGPTESPLAVTEAELYAEKCLSFVAFSRSSENLYRVSPE